MLLTQQTSLRLKVLKSSGVVPGRQAEAFSLFSWSTSSRCCFPVLTTVLAVAFASLRGAAGVVSVREVAAHQHSSWPGAATEMFVSVQMLGCLHVRQYHTLLWIFEASGAVWTLLSFFFVLLTMPGLQTVRP